MADEAILILNRASLKGCFAEHCSLRNDVRAAELMTGICYV